MSSFSHEPTVAADRGVDVIRLDALMGSLDLASRIRAAAFDGVVPRDVRFAEAIGAAPASESAVWLGLDLTHTAPPDDALGPSIARRVESCLQAGVPVHVLAAALDDPLSDSQRDRFGELADRIASWSVRSAGSRETLRAFGVDDQRIVVGADWQWLYQRTAVSLEAAHGEWRRLGLDPRVPMVVVDARRWDDLPQQFLVSLAAALDHLATSVGAQVVIADDGRDAPILRAAMARPAVVLQVASWEPDRWLALLSAALAVVTNCYSVVVQAALAETHVVPLPGRPALAALVSELSLERQPLSTDLDPQRFTDEVARGDRARAVALLQGARRRLQARAENNLAWWPVRSDAGAVQQRARLIEGMSSMMWYHRIELAPGVVTPGQQWSELWDPIQRHHEEVDFRGKTVLEIGCWDAYWSFEAERLGAAEVWATDDMSQRRSVTRTVPFAIAARGSRVRYLDDVSVYDVDERFARTFDVVVFYGVLYHLRYPALALAKLRRVLAPGGLLLVETAVLPDVEEPLMRWGYRAIYPDDPSSWNAVSLACLVEMLTSSYFEVELAEVFLKYPRVGRGYVRARAVSQTVPDRHPVPDRFLGRPRRGPEEREGPE